MSYHDKSQANRWCDLSFLSSYFSNTPQQIAIIPFKVAHLPTRPLLPTIFKTSAPHHPSRIVQYRNAQLKPPVRPLKKQPQPLHRVRYHQPRQIPLPQRSLDVDVQVPPVPLHVLSRYGTVALRGDSFLNELVLRGSCESEKRRPVNAKPIVAQNYGCGCVGNPELVGVWARGVKGEW